MPKDSSGLLSIEVWEHLREAQILYDGAVNIVINQSRGKFHHRPNGYSSLRVTGLRIVLIIEYGERISKSALSSRISKLVEAKQDTLKLSGWAKSSVQDPNIQKYIQERRTPTSDLVAAAQARYTRAIPAPEGGKTLHLNYWMKPLPCGNGYEFHPVKAIQTLVEEGMHPELCQFKVEGDSLANLKLSFRTQWGFSKSARVTIFDDSKPSNVWSMDAPGPRGRNNRSLDDHFVDFAFPPEAVDYAMGCNPATSTFAVILELQDTSLCMNMALSRICDRIAPLGKLSFWFSHYKSMATANLPGSTFTPPPAFSTPSHSSIRPLFTREALTRSPWREGAVVDSAIPDNGMTTGSQSHSSSMDVSILSPETRQRFSPLLSGFRSPLNVQSLGALPVRKGCVSSMPSSVPSSVTPETVREVPLQVDGQQTPSTPFAKVPHSPTERPIPIQFIPEGETHFRSSPCDEEAHRAPPFSKSYCMLEAVVSDRLVGGGPGVSPTPIKAMTRAAERATYPSRLLHTHEKAQIMTVGQIVTRRCVNEDRDPLQIMMRLNGTNMLGEDPIASPVQPREVVPEVRGPEVPVDGEIGAGDSTSPSQPLVHGYPSDPAFPFGGRDASSFNDGVYKEHALKQAMPSHQSASLGKAWGMSSEGSLPKKFEGTHCAERESTFPEIVSDTEGCGPSTDNSRTGHYEDYGTERYVWSTGGDLNPAIGEGLATVDQSTPLTAYPFDDAGGPNVSAMDIFGTGSHPLTLHSGPVSAGFSYHLSIHDETHGLSAYCPDGDLSYRPLQCLGIPAEDGTLYCHRESSSVQTLSGLISGEGGSLDPVCPDGVNGMSSLAFELYDWDTFFFGSSGFP